MKRTVLMGAAIAAASLLAGCSASTNSTTPTPTSAPAQATTPTPAPTTTATPTAVAAAAGPLSGTWTGSYNGLFNGTFTLTWQEAGANLDGTIALSSPNETLHISGTAGSSALTFGAVGVVTYTGTVSGNSMSGTYKAPNGSGGSWTASKS